MTDPLLAVLRELRDKVPQLNGSLIASKDGFLLASDLPEGVEADGMAAITATGLSLSSYAMSTASASEEAESDQAEADEVVIHNDGGHVVIYAAGPSAALAVLTAPEVSVGSLHLEARPAAQAIARLRSDEYAGEDSGY
jgi:predicted regulator of Ras-like GTPase activity (Roadblock/LC7/MglB family)